MSIESMCIYRQILPLSPGEEPKPATDRTTFEFADVFTADYVVCDAPSGCRRNCPCMWNAPMETNYRYFFYRPHTVSKF